MNIHEKLPELAEADSRASPLGRRGDERLEEHPRFLGPLPAHNGRPAAQLVCRLALTV